MPLLFFLCFDYDVGDSSVEGVVVAVVVNRVVWEKTGLVTNSILFCWDSTIKDQCKNASVVFDGVVSWDFSA